ncbi:TerD family protein [Nocardia rhamnosiphila]|uniref:TerD family protein n=1 Tax=Nocardia rhamnosiphila TaxID=426716 RepID=A0ABV2WXS1_9NOCA
MQPDSVVSAVSSGAGLGSFTVVDVETSGLSAADHRVLSVAALALDSDGVVVREFHTLVDSGCDPGPVHIHGLTRELLSGAPRFENIEAELTQLLAGRVMVAHNAGFDYGFLAGEYGRIGASLPVGNRLCTLALARRVALPVSDCRLATLATHYGIQQQRAHDALDDARVLAAVLRCLVADAAHLGITLPMLACPPDRSGAGRRSAWPSTPPKTRCEFEYPGRFTDGGVLVRGMKVAFTGDTRVDRAELISRAVAAGLDVTGAVSGRTSALVTNAQESLTGKARAARGYRTPIMTEQTFLMLLERIQPGTPKNMSEPAGKAGSVRGKRTEAAGPLAGRRVLVLGGPHNAAVEARSRIADLGASVAVNMSASVSDVLALDDAQSDPRLGRAVARGLPVHGPELLDSPSSSSPGGVNAQEIAEPHTMSRGQVMDLPIEALGTEWFVRVLWTQSESYEVDVVGFLLDSGEKVRHDPDFVFYNQPAGDGACLTADGPSEQSVELSIEQLPQHCARVAIAAAIDGDSVTFGTVGAIEIEVTAGSEAGVFARATLDAATEERTLILVEVYRRGETWRLRAVGQGYSSGLGELARSYGVDVSGN